MDERRPHLRRNFKSNLWLAGFLAPIYLAMLIWILTPIPSWMQHGSGPDLTVIKVATCLVLLVLSAQSIQYFVSVIMRIRDSVFPGNAFSLLLPIAFGLLVQWSIYRSTLFPLSLGAFCLAAKAFQLRSWVFKDLPGLAESSKRHFAELYMGFVVFSVVMLFVASMVDLGLIPAGIRGEDTPAYQRVVSELRSVMGADPTVKELVAYVRSLENELETWKTILFGVAVGGLAITGGVFIWRIIRQLGSSSREELLDDLETCYEHKDKPVP